MFFHNELNAVKFSLEQLIKNNSTTRILIGRDGLPINSVIDNFNSFNLETIADSDCHTRVLKKEIQGFDVKNFTLQETLQILLCHINRLNLASLKSKTEFMLLLEPDVWVRKKINNPPSKDLETLTSNKYPKRLINLLENEKNETFELEGWGACTAFFRTASIQQVHEWTFKNTDYVKYLIKVDWRMLYADFALPILFFLAGCTIGKSPSMIECNRNLFWRFSSAPIVHQYKRYY